MDQKELIERLQGIANFSDLNKPELLNIVKGSYLRTCRKEMSIYYQGEPAETVPVPQDAGDPVGLRREPAVELEIDVHAAPRRAAQLARRQPGCHGRIRPAARHHRG